VVVWTDFVSFLLLEGSFLNPVSPTAYAATTQDRDYVKMEGLKQLVSDQEHRQEIVANGLGSYLSGRAFISAIRTVLLFIAPF
jgi:hypothetical protein